MLTVNQYFTYSLLYPQSLSVTGQICLCYFWNKTLDQEDSWAFRVLSALSMDMTLNQIGTGSEILEKCKADVIIDYISMFENLDLFFIR